MANIRQKMARWRKRLFKIGGLMCGGLALGTWANFHLILTPSVPMGLYRGTMEPVRRGAYVSVCLPLELAMFAKERGYLGFWIICDGWVQGVVKTVGAVAGDIVQINESEVKVNGVALPNSRTLLTDSKGRPMPHLEWGTYRVKHGEVWLFATHDPRALDSRYWGPISTKHVRTTELPLWVEE